jgi:hypothetical protein
MGGKKLMVVSETGEQDQRRRAEEGHAAGELPQHDRVDDAVLARRVEEHSHPAQPDDVELGVEGAAAEQREDGSVGRPHDEDQQHRRNAGKIEIIGNHAALLLAAGMGL